MDKHISKISSEWIRETRAMFIRFLEETGFSNPERLGERFSNILNGLSCSFLFFR